MNAMAGPLSPVGSITAMICEASDCAMTPGCVVADGMSGDTDFPYVHMKVLATVGEIDKETGHMLVGVPDGMGTYLLDDDTVRVVFQSESYGPLSAQESYPFIVNEKSGASFTGSHVMYVDYDREMLSRFMENTESAEHMVLGSGEVVKAAYNLKGQLIEPRSTTGACCSPAPHFSNTDENGCGCWGEIMFSAEPSRADWLMQSLCSAHLEVKHQWGEGNGVEDTLFITNEEWTSFVPGAPYTGIPAHAIELANGNMHAVGAMTLGGFEKIVEVNCGHPDYVCFSPSGYNGNFGVQSDLKRDYLRPDGQPYVNPQDIVPARLYIGKKGYNAKGEPADDFLSRNGLAHGQLYGFATDVDQTTGGVYRDAFHRSAAPGTTVAGGFYPIDWMWDGEVRDFEHDGSWDFQHATPGGYFWTAEGPNMSGYKTEHNSPDPYGGSRFVQGSTAGYFGIYDFTGVGGLISAAHGFPGAIPATYHLLEGERDIVGQIMLGGKGLKANGMDQTTMSDSYGVAEDGTVTDSAKRTFEDIDGLEWFASSDAPENGYVVIQEDGGNDFGERTFISKVETDGTPMTYYFIAQSGGDDNTRNKAGVGIPKGTNAMDGSAHEFSGAFDLSGLLAKHGDDWMVHAADAGTAKRHAETTMHINQKVIAVGLQAHSLSAGIIASFQGDRGGQIYAFKPMLPEH
jgi:hypothetical protein